MDVHDPTMGRCMAQVSAVYTGDSAQAKELTMPGRAGAAARWWYKLVEVHPNWLLVNLVADGCLTILGIAG